LSFEIEKFFTSRQVRVLTDLFASCLMNAYVLRRSKLNLPRKYTSFHFLENLLQQMTPSDAPLPPPAAPKPHPAGYDRNGRVRAVEAPFWNGKAGKAFRLDGIDHWCEDANNTYFKLSEKRNERGVFIRNELRRTCRWCKDKTVFFCTKCVAPLCVGNCFRSFHTIDQIKILKCVARIRLRWECAG
jgi:hypothetical protein